MNDLVSRQAAIENIKEYAQAAHSNYEWDVEQGFIDAIECLEELPSAQPERKKGKWLDNETSFADGVRQTCTCSICGRRSTRPIGRFCRWCGADMIGEKGENCNDND